MWKYKRSPRKKARYTRTVDRSTQNYACYPRHPYIAVVAEKPKAAEKIAYALGKGVKCRYKGIPYWSIQIDGRRIFVVPSAGHLFGPYSPKRGFPVYEFEWRPIFEFDRKASHLRKFYDLMKYILPNASLYINACDYDIEGSVIGYTIIYYIGDPSRYKRMKFSSLSPTELRRAFERLEPPDISLVEAGMARHEIDWIWGINVSRALMHAARKVTGQRIILSAGRVQSPTIVEAVRRWREINLAVPTPEFSLVLECLHHNVSFKAYPHGWRPESKEEASSIVSYFKKNPVLNVSKIESNKISVQPPPAFNLGDLQKEAARLYKFSPMKTQKLAEDLYLEALISYPRTNSQKLPPTINYKNIILRLSKSEYYGSLATKILLENPILKPVQGRKDDPAHPAIHPTGVIPKYLDADHRKIYDLIVRRFLAAFAPRAVISRTKAELIDKFGRKYSAKGVTVIEEGWYHYYPYLRPKEEELPLLGTGENVRVTKASYRTNWSRNVPDLSRTALLKWMESVNIGTEATRARIIEVLFSRGYLESRGGKTVVTELGESIAEIISTLFPELSKPDLTRDMEQKLELVRRGLLTRKKVVEETKSIMDSLIRNFNERLEDVGYKISVALGAIRPDTTCILCGKPAKIKNGINLCEHHHEALLRLERALPEISRRLGVDEDKAIKSIARLRGKAGRWVIEVAANWDQIGSRGSKNTVQ